MVGLLGGVQMRVKIIRNLLICGCVRMSVSVMGETMDKSSLCGKAMGMIYCFSFREIMESLMLLI